MNIQELEAQLLLVIETNIAYEKQMNESLQILHAFKESGGTQLDAVRLLDSMRVEAKGEPQEAVFEDLIEFAIGFCHPSKYIWETRIKTW